MADVPRRTVTGFGFRVNVRDAPVPETLMREVQRLGGQTGVPAFADLLDLQANASADAADLPTDEEVGDQSAAHATTEQAVAALFTELLGHERIGVGDNFFALGGHSLLAARLVALVRKNFHVELTLLDLFDNPTVAGVAAFIEGVFGATS